MGKGVYAHHIEYKTMTMTLLSWSSSLVYLHHVLATSLTTTRSCLPIKWFVALGPWVCISLSSMGAGDVVVRGCWSFDGHCGWFSWLLGGQCRSLGAGRGLPLAVCLRVVVDWAVVVCWAAGFVCGGCVTWQRATGMAHSVLLTLGMWACDCRVWLSGGCRGLWAARDVRGGGCCVWATWWQAVVEVVVVG